MNVDEQSLPIQEGPGGAVNPSYVIMVLWSPGLMDMIISTVIFMVMIPEGSNNNWAEYRAVH